MGEVERSTTFDSSSSNAAEKGGKLSLEQRRASGQREIEQVGRSRGVRICLVVKRTMRREERRRHLGRIDGDEGAVEKGEASWEDHRIEELEWQGNDGRSIGLDLGK